LSLAAPLWLGCPDSRGGGEVGGAAGQKRKWEERSGAVSCICSPCHARLAVGFLFPATWNIYFSVCAKFLFLIPALLAHVAWLAEHGAVAVSVHASLDSQGGL
jgi:hypothetical protein